MGKWVAAYLNSKLSFNIITAACPVITVYVKLVEWVSPCSQSCSNTLLKTQNLFLLLLGFFFLCYDLTPKATICLVRVLAHATFLP